MDYSLVNTELELLNMKDKILAILNAYDSNTGFGIDGAAEELITLFNKREKEILDKSKEAFYDSPMAYEKFKDNIKEANK